MFPKVLTGLPKPDKDELSITLNEMRAEIYKHSRDCPTINRALMTAEHNGFSGEDKYALLAYYALRQLHETHKHLTAFVNCTPNSFAVLFPTRTHDVPEARTTTPLDPLPFPGSIQWRKEDSQRYRKG